MNDLTLHFGLGDHQDAVELEISWPHTKSRQRFTSQINRTVIIKKEWLTKFPKCAACLMLTCTLRGIG